MITYILLFFLAISLLTFGVYQNYKFINTIDEKYLDYFHSIQSKTLDIFFSFITWLGSLWIILPIFASLIFILIKNSLYNLSLYLSIGFLGAIGTTYSLKYILSKKRPEVYKAIDELPPDPSFPSAHTTQIFIFALLLILVVYYLEFSNKYIWVITLISLALIVAISRIYLQVHYLSDIIGGAFISIFWFLITYYFISQKEVL